MEKKVARKVVRVVMKMNVEGKTERGRPKIRLLNTIDNDKRAAGVCVEDVENREVEV